MAEARITANVLSALQSGISNLSAISANIGTITSGTITGTTVRTSASGNRVEMTAGGLTVYDSGGAIGAFDWGGAWIASNAVFNFAGTGNNLGQIYYSTDVLGFHIKSSYKVYIDSGSNPTVISGYLSLGSGLGLSSALDMNNNLIQEVGYMRFNTAGNKTTSGELWFYDAGSGNYFWRSRNGSWNGQFDQSAF